MKTTLEYIERLIIKYMKKRAYFLNKKDRATKLENKIRYGVKATEARKFKQILIFLRNTLKNEIP